MSDDEDNQVDSEANMFDGNDGSDGMGFGPLILTEGERSLVERVRKELKNELKQVTLFENASFIIVYGALLTNKTFPTSRVTRKSLSISGKRSCANAGLGNFLEIPHLY
jgi:hypothetical protein